MSVGESAHVLAAAACGGFCAALLLMTGLAQASPPASEEKPACKQGTISVGNETVACPTGKMVFFSEKDALDAANAPETSSSPGVLFNPSPHYTSFSGHSSCSFHWDFCADDFRMDVGAVESWFDESGTAHIYSDAYHDSGDCGWEYDAMQDTHVDWDDPLVFYLDYGAVGHFDSGGTEYTQAEVELQCYQFVKGSTSCSGSAYQLTAETETCEASAECLGEEWKRYYADSRADCDGAYGDPASTPYECNLIDILVPNPPDLSSGQTATYYYRCDITVTTTTAEGEYGSPVVDYGCFKIEWHRP